MHVSVRAWFRGLDPAAFLLAAAQANALSVTSSLDMTGAQEIPGRGDPDGLGTGVLTIDDTTGLVSCPLDFHVDFHNDSFPGSRAAPSAVRSAP